MPKLDNPFETTTISFRILPWDIDPYNELNNGRYLTLMDLGRYAHAYRLNLSTALKENKWGLMVAGVSTRFRYRIKMFQKVQLHSKIIYIDDRWFYFHQWYTTQSNGKEKKNASFLVRTGVTSKNGIVASAELVKALGYDADYVASLNQPNEWIDAWVKSDEFHKNIKE